MPLQNRVTPFGEIVAVPERGTLLGNRGILHDDDGRLVRSLAGAALDRLSHSISRAPSPAPAAPLVDGALLP